MLAAFTQIANDFCLPSQQGRQIAPNISMVATVQPMLANRCALQFGIREREANDNQQKFAKAASAF